MTLRTTTYAAECGGDLTISRRGALWAIAIAASDDSAVEFEFDSQTACMIREFIAEDIPTCTHRLAVDEDDPWDEADHG